MLISHGRSGSVALPRVKEVVAGWASLDVVETPRSVLRAAVGRKRADDMSMTIKVFVEEQLSVLLKVDSL